MAEELVTVKTFWNVIEAHLAKSAIHEAGIQAFLENEHMTLDGVPSPGVKLNVKRSDVQKAIAALKPQD